MLFQQIEGEQAILKINGVFTQVDLYQRGTELFARHGAGYVRLFADGSTSKPKLVLDTITFSELYRDKLGRMTLDRQHKPITIDDGGRPLPPLPKPEKTK